MKVLKKYALLFTLFSLSIFQAQSSASSLSRFAAAASKKARPVAIKTGIGLAGGAGTYYATKYALSYPKSSTISPEYLAKQEQLDEDHELDHKEEQRRKEIIKEILKELKLDDILREIKEEAKRDIDTYLPKVSERHYPYAFRWLEEFKKEHPDAGFSSTIFFREDNDAEDFYARNISVPYEQDGTKYLAHSEDIIGLPSTKLKKLNEVAQKKYTHSKTFSPEDRTYLDLTEAILFHEMYHLLDGNHAHGRTTSVAVHLGSNRYHDHIRYEEFCADEHTIIHGTSQHLKASKLFHADTTEFIESQDPLIQDLQRQKAATWFWEYEKRKQLDNQIKARYQELYPDHLTPPDRLAYFEAAYKEKKALEERLARETPEENEENLRKLLERGPRQSSSRSDPATRLQ